MPTNIEICVQGAATQPCWLATFGVKSFGFFRWFLSFFWGGGGGGYYFKSWQLQRPSIHFDTNSKATKTAEAAKKYKSRKTFVSGCLS